MIIKQNKINTDDLQLLIKTLEALNQNLLFKNKALHSSYKKEDQELIDNTDKWSIQEDMYNEELIYYRDIPVDEIIYCLGELHLAMIQDISSIQKEYYETDNADTFNIALKLIRDIEFAKYFYDNYKEIQKEKIII